MSQVENTDEVIINTGIEPSFLAETLTTDIELTDALFDLIDNSIDAARDQILLQDNLKSDSYGLPADYSGYHIRLRFSANSITIKDNCAGFDEDTLTNSAFITGKRSNHQFGIGHYGLGLKRALLKVGSRFGLVTDNGVARYRAIFNSSSFSGSEKNQIPARRYPTKSKPFSLFTVSDLFADIRYQIADPAWFDYAKNKLGVRYGIFIQKGLQITIVNSTSDGRVIHRVESSIPNVRKGKPLTPFSDRMNIDGLDVYFNVGVHEKYKFAGEEDHDTKKNGLISEAYGLYFISNDRVIVDASTDKKHGFTTSWHNEYSGFICLIRMIGNDPGKLPWNTAKTELKLGSSAFIRIREKVEQVAKEYRSRSKTLINIWKDIRNDSSIEMDERKVVFAERTGLTFSKLPKNASKAVEKDRTKIKSKNTPLKAGEKPKTTAVEAKDIKKRAENNKGNHTQHWITLLPARFPISEDHEVLDNLIIESISLEMRSAPHASSMLYRSLLETASRRFVKSRNLFVDIKEYYYSRGEGKRKNHSEEYRKNQSVDLNMVADWLVVQSDIFPPEERNELKVSAKKMKGHIKILNGIVHGLQPTNDSQLSIIRNDTIQMLRFLVS
ncbi:ATP-binding protein [Vibrio fluvialis]|uniref:ATP-binding protein n=1 Tax=Vibrio fluvialis TaxID=676 RepID=UPI001C9BF562|nr:ATP-binding protein [Vibrio fluvialis]MBY8286718.1 ATP-binding protein [Vibrio fluvialis]MCE7613251.1 ATP-binding protein [Vibrio fluvialis]